MSDGKNRRYLSKTEREYASKLAYKQFLKIKLQQIKMELRKMKALSNASSLINSKMTNLLSNPGFQELLLPYHIYKESDIDWMNASYPQNDYHLEGLIHETVQGIKVRSKSESMIAMVLCQNSIPFRYECKLVLNENEFTYPDFTLKRPGDGELVYWEHLGMIDQIDYYEKNQQKIKKYIDCGILPGRNLILTYETSTSPLTYELIERTVQAYLI